MPAMFAYLPDLPSTVDVYSRVAILLIAGIVLAEFGQRHLRLPRLSGYVLAGILLGPEVLNWAPSATSGELRPLMLLGLGLLLFEIGSRVDLRWLRVNPMLIQRSLAEAGLTFGGVYAYLHLAGFVPATCVSVAAIAVSTSPTVVMRVIAETGAKGQMTQQLLLFTALNSLYAILLLKVGLAFVHANQQRDLLQILGHPAYLTCGSFLLAYLVARANVWLESMHLRRESERFSLTASILLLSTAMADQLNLSVPMVLLCAGMLMRTTSDRLQLFPEHFGSAGALLVIVLFVLTGVALKPSYIWAGGLLSLGLLVVRAAAKYAGARWRAEHSGLTPLKAGWLGVAMWPMSSLAVLQAYDLADLYPEFGGEIVAIVLGAVVVMELLSPILTQYALRRVGEAAAPTAKMSQ